MAKRGQELGECLKSVAVLVRFMNMALVAVVSEPVYNPRVVLERCMTEKGMARRPQSNNIDDENTSLRVLVLIWDEVFKK